jgi:hypothetical protein
MKEKKNKNDDSHSLDFLLNEYRSHKESFWKSEELGERRVNFFITVVTAILAALAIREKGVIDYTGKVHSIFFYGCAASLLYGWVTLVRLIRRNLESHKDLRAIGRIRHYFTEKNPEILKYLYYESRDDVPYRKKKWIEILSLGTGGLVETVSLINSVIFASICGLVSISLSLKFPFGMAVGGFILAWIAQFLYVKTKYHKGKPKDNEIKFPGNEKK